MTINTIKSTKSQIEKIKNNIYYEIQNNNIKTNMEIKDNNKFYSFGHPKRDIFCMLPMTE